MTNTATLLFPYMTTNTTVTLSCQIGSNPPSKLTTTAFFKLGGADYS